MKTKYAYPPFLVMVATVIVGFVHKLTGYQLDIDLASGALVVVVNYLVAQFLSDFKKVKSGQPVGSFNSLKLITVLFICVVLGVSNYLQLDYTTEELMLFCGSAMLVITGKSIKDILGLPNGGEKGNDDDFTTPIEPRV